MSKQTLHIYQDESGSLADSSGTVVIIALVTTLDPWSLRFITKKVYKKFLAKKGKKYKNRGRKEFKYITALPPERKSVLNILKDKEVKIFALGIKKGRKKIDDSPLNYGISLLEILSALFAYYQKQNLQFELILDKHYTKKKQLKELDTIIKMVLPVGIQPVHQDSQSSPFIALADFAAGALRDEFVKNDSALSSIIAEKIVVKEKILWADLKHKWLGKIK